MKTKFHTDYSKLSVINLTGGLDSSPRIKKRRRPVVRIGRSYSHMQPRVVAAETWPGAQLRF